MVELLETSRRASARAINSLMTATYWEIGRRIVELEQGGKGRAKYGEEMVKRLAVDLTEEFGRGFTWINLYRMRRLYLAYPEILSTVLTKLGDDCGLDVGRTKMPGKPSSEILPTVLTISDPRENIAVIQCIASSFPLPWSHYLKLLSIDDKNARQFYEEEALRGGWSVRQLDRQINSQFYERTLLSKNKAAMIRKGAKPRPEDAVKPEEEIKDPLVLEFLDLKDEYSENELEEALVKKLEEFLLELGSDFTFVGRQRRLRIGNKWYRIDLLFFHRRLRCLVVIDLKIGEFDHADAGQMHMYLNYAAKHWTHDNENPPVGLILCASRDQAVARYALDGLPNQVMAAEYKLALPNESTLVAELEKTQKQFAGVHTRPKEPAPKKARKKPATRSKKNTPKKSKKKATRKKK
ncbi:MAG: PDDEXK nuclease domain-containing protein [Planctomycetota bacterium]|nr:PDDEXK nuclease domain-containing protein [Planctomycetota bacterium]MDP7248471.1 PDDEXK nuclease domain-containing protein [Planctomycetota bacterium]